MSSRRLRVEHGGFLYDSHAYNDGLPYRVRVGEQPQLVLPNVFDTNDMKFFDSSAFVRGNDFAGDAIDAFDFREPVARHFIAAVPSERA